MEKDNQKEQQTSHGKSQPSDVERYEKLQAAAERQIQNIWVAYDHHAGLLKTAVVAIAALAGVLVAIGSWFFYSNVSEMRKEAREQMSETLTQASNRVESTVQGMTRTAKEQANEASQEEIAKIFKDDTHLQTIISTTMSNFTSDFQKRFDSLRKLETAAARSQFGLKSGVDDFITMSDPTNDENVRIVAKELLNSVTKDYDRGAEDPIMHLRWASEGSAMYPGCVSASLHLKDINELTFSLLTTNILHNPSLNAVSAGFYMMREHASSNFNMFDFEAIKNWAAEHPNVMHEKVWGRKYDSTSDKMRDL